MKYLAISVLFLAVVAQAKVTLHGSWQNYGGDFEPLTARIRNGVCVVQGLVKNGKPGAVATLPPNCRPNKVLIFNVMGKSQTHHFGHPRVDVTPNGVITAGANTHQWLSLTGIKFVPGTKYQKPLQLLGGWKPYAGSPTFSKVHGVCSLEGNLVHGKDWHKFAQLPENCRPSKRLIFNVNNGAQSARIDVDVNGIVGWHAGGQDAHWISVSGIVFYAKDPGQIPVKGSQDATMIVRGGLCLVAGTFPGGKPLPALPNPCRPAGHLIFNLNNNQHSVRIDVRPNGQVIHREGVLSAGHQLSLSGIVFATASIVDSSHSGAAFYKYLGDQQNAGTDERGIGYHNKRDSQYNGKLPKDCAFCIGEKCRRHCIQSELHKKSAGDESSLTVTLTKQAQQAHAAADALDIKLKAAKSRFAYHTRKKAEWWIAAKDQHALDLAMQKLKTSTFDLAAAQKEYKAAKNAKEAAAAKRDQEIAKSKKAKALLATAKANKKLKEDALKQNENDITSLKKKLANAETLNKKLKRELATHIGDIAKHTKEQQDADKNHTDHEKARKKHEAAQVNATKRITKHQQAVKNSDHQHLKDKAKKSHTKAKGKLLETKDELEDDTKDELDDSFLETEEEFERDFF